MVSFIICSLIFSIFHSTMKLTGPSMGKKEKHGAITAPVERLVIRRLLLSIRYLFLTQFLALISGLIFGSWYYMLMVLASFCYCGLHLFVFWRCLVVSFSLPFILLKHIGESTEDETTK